MVAAQANDGPLRISLIATYSGPCADFGQQFDCGRRAIPKRAQRKMGGHTVEIIRKYTGGPAPSIAKRMAQELMVRDKVNILTGLDFSPNA